jgi:hypothetical protein
VGIESAILDWQLPCLVSCICVILQKLDSARRFNDYLFQFRTWALFCVISFLDFFVIWAAMYALRSLSIRHNYSLMKATFALYGVWMPLVWLIWVCCEFAVLQLLLIWGLHPNVEFWITRILFSLLTLSIFWLTFESVRRLLLVAIERDTMWKRLALLFWREELLRDLVTACDQMSLNDEDLLRPMKDANNIFGDSFHASFSRPLAQLSDLRLEYQPSLDEFGENFCSCCTFLCLKNNV